MSDLISRKVVIDEIQLIEKDLLQDKNDAENSDDGEMIFAINNQLNVLWRVKSRVRGLPTAYDVDKVVEDMEFDKGMVEGVKIIEREKKLVDITWQRAIEIVKGGGVE